MATSGKAEALTWTDRHPPIILSRFHWRHPTALATTLAKLALVAFLSAVLLGLLGPIVGSMIEGRSIEMRRLLTPGGYAQVARWHQAPGIYAALWGGWSLLLFTLLVIHTRDRTTTAWLHAERLVIRGPRIETDVPLRHIGSIHLDAGAVRFGIAGAMATVAVPIVRGIAEDEFERVVRHLDSQAPGHLFSAHAESDCSYSRSFDLEELRPDLGELQAVRIERNASRADIHAADRVFKYFWHPRRLRDAEGNRILTRHANDIELDSGLFAGRITEFADDASKVFSIGFNTTEDFWIDARGWILHGADRIGTVQSAGTSLELSFDRPRPAILMLMLAVTLADSAERDRHWRRRVAPDLELDGPH